MGRALLDQLLADGILQLKGKFYHWSPDRADQLLGVSWTALRSGEVGKGVTDYLEAFIAKHGDLF
jgi:hypothetical protein